MYFVSFLWNFTVIKENKIFTIMTSCRLRGTCPWFTLRRSPPLVPAPFWMLRPHSTVTLGGVRRLRRPCSFLSRDQWAHVLGKEPEKPFPQQACEGVLPAVWGPAFHLNVRLVLNWGRAWHNGHAQ